VGARVVLSDGRADQRGKELHEWPLGSTSPAPGSRPRKYDTTLAQIDEAGQGTPDGRLYHVALETDGEIQVYDIWESQASFDAFGETLLPILTGAGIGLNPPMVATVHNVIEG
jgi:hypothetical protein